MSTNAIWAGAALLTLALGQVPFDAAPNGPSREEAEQYLREARRSADADTLVHAAMMHDADLVEAVLAAGVSPDARGILPQSALHLVSSTQCQDPPNGREAQMRIIEALIAHGANVHDNSFGNTEIIIWAAQQCPPMVVKRLLEAGAKIEARSPQGYSPLSMALVVKNYDSAEFLIEKGARLKPETIERLFSQPGDDARLKAILQKARAGK